MPPAKSRLAQDDSGSTGKDKASHASNARGRRNGTSNMVNGSSLKEVMNSNADSSTSAAQNVQSASSTSWRKEDTAVLHAYRSAYRLDIPSSFKNPLGHILLDQGIGKFSPTMARQKQKKRVSKDTLALAVRKNFNALAVNEQEVIVDFLYKVKMKDKDLRVRFAPSKK